MKFSFKVFLLTIIITTLSFSIGGYVLISSFFKTSLNREIDLALKENSYLSSYINSLSKTFLYTKVELTEDIIKNIYDILPFGENLVRIREENSIIASNTNLLLHENLVSEVKDGQVVYKIVEDKNNYYIQSMSKFPIKNQFIYLEIIQDITSIYEQRDQYYKIYKVTLLGMTLCTLTILIIMSYFLTKPLEKLSSATAKIANGDFSNRVKVRGKDEIATLTRDFNKMAEVIEEKISVLENTSRQKEEFVASFAHELKTPLTSIIGYADFLRSCEAKEKERLLCANYIFNEGKRLEALSFSLMELIVLNKTDFNMVGIDSKVLLDDIKSVLEPFAKEKNISINLDVEKSILKVEPILIKTLFYNIIDNAIKACDTNGKVSIIGNLKGFGYEFQIIDNGRGISEEDIENITEAFYTVDKSRSRSQNGIGLGLAIASKIAKIHGTNLKFKSSLGEETTVSFSLGGNNNE